MTKKSSKKFKFPKNSLLADERFQDEWDFCYLGSLGINTLNLALIYEYTRECPWIVDAVNKWLDIRFPEPNQQDYESGAEIIFLPEFFIGKKIRDTLTILGKATREEYPEDVLKAILRNILEFAPSQVDGHSISGCFCFLVHWPRPFSTIYKSDCWINYLALDNLFNEPFKLDSSDSYFDKHPEARRIMIHKEKHGKPLDEIPQERVQEFYAKKQNDGTRIATFSIDFNQSRADLVDLFKSWLTLVKHKSPKKDPEDFYKNRLKWLSAKRLKAFYKEKGVTASRLMEDLEFIFDSEALEKRKIHSLIPACSGPTNIDKMVRKSKKFTKEKIAVTQQTVRSSSKKGGLQLSLITEPWLK